jgi:hypothetical protein
MIGGGNYLEYESLATWASPAKPLCSSWPSWGEEAAHESGDAGEIEVALRTAVAEMWRTGAADSVGP